MNKKKGARTDSVSIGMPVYNAASCIRESLDSLLAQTYKNFELIISDNASSDNTDKICQAYAKKDKRVRYIRQKENIGACENFNFVLKQATGEYFMWASDDDLWDVDFIKCIMDEYRKTPEQENVGLISPRWIFMYSKANPMKVKEISGGDKYKTSYLTFKGLLKDAGFQMPCVYGIFRKKMLVKAGVYTRPFTAFSDYVLIANFISLHRIKIIEKVLFFKRQDRIPVRTVFQSDENVMKKILHILDEIKMIAPNFILNLFPPNMLYFVRRAKMHYDWNSKLIETYYNRQEASLKRINLIASFKLFIYLLPCSLKYLKEFEKY